MIIVLIILRRSTTPCRLLKRIHSVQKGRKRGGRKLSVRGYRGETFAKCEKKDRCPRKGKETTANPRSLHPVIAPRFHPFPSITKLPQSVATSHKDTALDTENCTRALPYKDMCILRRE